MGIPSYPQLGLSLSLSLSLLFSRETLQKIKNSRERTTQNEEEEEEEEEEKKLSFEAFRFHSVDRRNKR